MFRLRNIILFLIGAVVVNFLLNERRNLMTQVSELPDRLEGM